MTAPARLVLVVPSFAIGGAERVMVLLAEGLAAAGHDVTLVAIDGSGPLRPRTPAGHGPAVIDLGARRAVTSLPALVRTIRALRATVVVTSHTHVSALLILGRRLLGRTVRSVAREPGLWHGEPSEHPAVRAVRRWALRRADVVIASSPVMQQQLQTVLRRPVALLDNPVDIDGLRERATSGDRAAREGRWFVSVGRLAPGKGHEDVVEAFAAAAGSKDRLVLIGDGPLRGTLEERAAQPDLAGRVELTGALDDPSPHVAAADALLLASRSEGMPNVVLEALAVGTPVVVTDDLVTLGALVARTPDGAIRAVPRARLAEAIAATAPLGPRPREVLVPATWAVSSVVRRFAELVGVSGTAGPRRLRVMMPTLAPFPSTYVSSLQWANMAQSVAELGHDVLLVAANPDPSLARRDGWLDLTPVIGFEPAFAHLALASRVHRGQSYRNAVRIETLARRWDPDLVLSRDLRSCLLPARRGVPTVLEAHSLPSLTGRQERWFLDRLLRMPGFRGVIAISAALARDLTAELGIPEDRILVAHDAVRIAATDDGSPREGRPVSDGTLHAGYVGSLFAGRGVDVLVDVARRAPWLRLHLVGGPPEVAARLAEEVAEDVPGVVVHGQVLPPRARALQRTMDVLVAPFARRVGTDSGVDTSRWMSPMKVFEYMASGRPIVISDLPVLREVLRPDVDALMVPPEDPDALLHALERLRDDPALGARLAASALERVRSEFTWDLRARRILERFGA